MGILNLSSKSLCKAEPLLLVEADVKLEAIVNICCSKIGKKGVVGVTLNSKFGNNSSVQCPRLLRRGPRSLKMFVPPITRFLAKGPPKKCVIVTKLNSQPKCVNQVNTVIGKHASKLIVVRALLSQILCLKGAHMSQIPKLFIGRT